MSSTNPTAPIYLCEPFQGLIPLKKGNYLFGGKTGDGKSTLLANIIAHFLRNSKKFVIVLLNDEPEEYIFTRVACVLRGKDWIKWVNGALPEDALIEIEKCVSKLKKRLFVNTIPNETRKDIKTVNPRHLLHIKRVLYRAQVESERWGLIAVDYLQRITIPENRSLPTWEVYKELGDFLHDHGNSSKIPTLLFAQLKPPYQGGDFFSRIEGVNTIGANATVGIEIKPDRSTRTTTFIVHKDKYGTLAEKGVKAALEGTKYVKPRRNI
jgi:hypothetical protein